MLYLKYSLTKELLNDLPDNYKEMLNTNSKKLFLYANSIEILRYFRLTKIKSIDYDLYTKVCTFKKDLLLLNMIKEAKLNNLYKPNLTFLYSVAISFAVDEVLKKYELTDIERLCLDAVYANEQNVKLSNKYLYQNFKECFLFSLTELDFFSNSLKNTYNESATQSYILESIKQFKNIMSNNISYKTKNCFMNILRKDYLKSRNYSYKIYNPKKKIYKQINRIDIDIDAIKLKAKKEALELIEAVNQALYFDRQEPMVTFATKNNWDGITSYYKFITEQKDNEKQRKKLYKLKNKTNILNQKIKEALKKPKQ